MFFKVCIILVQAFLLCSKIERIIDNMRFGSKKVTDEKGVVWDSTTEYNYSLILNKLQEQGKIKDLTRQISYNLIPSFKDGQGNNIRKMDYVADFVYIDVATNNKVILDVKGSAFNIDPVFTNKWKLLKYNLKDEEFHKKKLSKKSIYFQNKYIPR